MVRKIQKGVERRRGNVRNFYRSFEWLNFRIQLLAGKDHERCRGCGSWNVADIRHIEDIATHWKLRLSVANIEFLCAVCLNERKEGAGRGTVSSEVSERIAI